MAWQNAALILAALLALAAPLAGAAGQDLKTPQTPWSNLSPDERRVLGALERANGAFGHPVFHGCSISDRHAAAALVMKRHPQSDELHEPARQGAVGEQRAAEGDQPRGHGRRVGHHPHQPLLQGARGVSVGHRPEFGVPLVNWQFSNSAHGARLPAFAAACPRCPAEKTSRRRRR